MASLICALKRKERIFMEETFTTSTELSAHERLLLFLLVGLFLACCFCAAAGFSAAATRVFVSYTRLALDVFLTGLFLGLIRLTLTKEMRDTIYVVSEDSFTKRSPYRIVSVAYGQITGFRFAGVPFLLRYGVVRYPGGSITISLRTKNLLGLISALQEKIIRAQTPAFREDNLVAFKRAALATEGANNRLGRFMPYCMGVTMLLATVNTITALFLWRLSFFPAFAWSLFGLFLFLAGIIAAETVIAFGNKPAARPALPPRTASGDADAYLLVGIIVFVIYLSCGILLKTVFRA
jgi:hypothetical protein